MGQAWRKKGRDLLMKDVFLKKKKNNNNLNINVVSLIVNWYYMLYSLDLIMSLSIFLSKIYNMKFGWIGCFFKLMRVNFVINSGLQY